MAIIGISGRIGSGKDTVGQIIQYLVCESKDTLAPHQKFEDLAKQIQEFGLAPISNKIQSGWEIKKFAGKLKQIVCLLTGATLEQLEDQEFKKQKLGSEWTKYNHNWTYREESEENSDYELINKDKKLYRYKGMDTLDTYRDLLQKLGTEAMRNVIHENVWVNALMADYKLQGYSYTVEGNKVASEIEHLYPNWIITDMRFPNEFDAIKSRNGITIRVNRIKAITSEIEKANDTYLGKVTWIPIPGIDVIEHPSETALDNHEFDYVIDNDGTISDLIEKVRTILIKEKVI